MLSQKRSKVGAALIALLTLFAWAGPASAQTDSSTETTAGDPPSTAPAPTPTTAPSTTAPQTTAPSTTAPPTTAPPTTAPPTSSATIVARRGDRGILVKDLQARLNTAGFSAGSVDGIYGRLTEAALIRFQRAVSLPATGVYDTTSRDALNTYKPSNLPPTDNGSATMTVRQAQARLVELGFNPGPVDGIYGSKTRAGLESFQRAAGVPVTGSIDAATVAAMATYSGPGDKTPGDGNSGSDTDYTSKQAIAAYQRALADGPFDPGPVDGVFGTKTRQAVWALEKLAGLPMNGQWGDAEAAALKQVNSGSIGRAKNSYSRRWVEVDLSQQLMMIYDPGRAAPVLVSHISSGSGVPWDNGKYSGKSITPTGEFSILYRISGWRESSLDIGRLYNPLYFTWGGIAFHGALSVPDHPASHGCVRVPMHIASYLPGLLPNGAPVVVRQ